MCRFLCGQCIFTFIVRIQSTFSKSNSNEPNTAHQITSLTNTTGRDYPSSTQRSHKNCNIYIRNEELCTNDVNKCFEEVFNLIISLISLLCTFLTLSTASMIQRISGCCSRVVFVSICITGLWHFQATGIEASYLTSLCLFFLTCKAGIFNSGYLVA